MKAIGIREAEKRLFNKHNGKIIMSKYIKMNSKAKFKCLDCGYVWEVKASGVITVGTGCPECAKQKNFEKMRLDVNFIKKFIESNNCKWIDGEYQNIDSKLLIMFECGHKEYQTFQSFKEGHRCIKCSYLHRGKRQMKTSKEIVETVESFGFTFLEFIGDYIGRKSFISYQCPNSHITVRKFSIFLKNPNCEQCQKLIRFKRTNNSEKEVNDYIASVGAKWISGTYKNDRSILTIMFECGHTQELPYYAFRNRKSNMCYNCTSKQRIENHRRSPEEFISIVESCGFIFNNFLGEYKGNTTKFEYQCKVCGGKNICSIWYFLKNKYCKICYKKILRISQLGENSPSWKGGDKRLSVFFRRFIKEWYLDSLKFTNYKCLITGNAAKTIHHLYPFYKIVEDFLLMKNISSKTTTKEFSSESLGELIDEFVPFHNSFGLGVPMTKEAHRFFHLIYSTMNNTPEQFYEFRQRIASGELKIPD
jgi:hypothetical protein